MFRKRQTSLAPPNSAAMETSGRSTSATLLSVGLDKSDADSISIKSTSALPSHMEEVKISDDEYNTFVLSAREAHFDHKQLHSLTDDDIKRFLTVNKGNRANAMKQVGATLEWRQSYDWDSLLKEDFSDVEASGKLSIKGLDKEGNPILIWRHSRHYPNQFPMDRDIRYMVHIIEKGKSTGIITNKITVIIDRIGITQVNYDANLVKVLLSTFQHHYPDRLARLFIFPKNMVLAMGWNVVKIFLDPHTITRIKILGEDEVNNTLQQFIEKDNLLTRFGGLVEDPTDLLPPLSPPSTSKHHHHGKSKHVPPRKSSAMPHKEEPKAETVATEESEVD